MENNNTQSLDKVTFAYTYDAVAEVLMADSAYIARSLYDVAAEKPSVASIMITEDDEEFVKANIVTACTDIITRLVAYVDDDTQFDVEPYTFILRLPSSRRLAIDSLITHELLRAISAFVLARWYESRLPDVAMRQQQLYDAAIAMLRHDVFMARGKVHRTTTYF